MQVTLLKSKLHRASITAVSPDYSGSLSIDRTLMKEAGFLHHEKILVGNITNGERFETYTILGERGSGQVGLNGPAARRVQVGDLIIIIAYGHMTPEEAKTHVPKLVFPETATNKLTA